MPGGPLISAFSLPEIQREMPRIVPYTTVVIAAFVPLAAGLYLLTTTAWTAAERAGFRWWTTSRAGRSRPGAAIAAGS